MADVPRTFMVRTTVAVIETLEFRFVALREDPNLEGLSRDKRAENHEVTIFIHDAPAIAALELEHDAVHAPAMAAKILGRAAERAPDVRRDDRDRDDLGVRMRDGRSGLAAVVVED